LFHEDAQIFELINLSILPHCYSPGGIRLAFREIIHNVVLIGTGSAALTAKVSIPSKVANFRKAKCFVS
jgi:hypothetical protein